MSEDERKAALARLDLLIAAMPLSPRPPDTSQYENKLNSRLQNFESKLSKT